MSETELRRQELLRQNRRRSNDSRIPAVHPRYSHVYNDLYNSEGGVKAPSSFWVRMFLGVLCFICYVWMDYGKITVAQVNSEQIVTQIEKQLQLKDIEEVWRKL